MPRRSDQDYAERGWRHAVTPALSGATEAEIQEQLRQAEAGTAEEKRTHLPCSGLVDLYDGRSGERFAHPVSVGYQYLMKLNHLAANKIRARATGAYTRRTQQPTKGSGQRVGEMEAWALQAHGAAEALQEMMTLKSDDLVARERLRRSLGEEQLTDVPEVGRTVAGETLVLVLRALGLNLTDGEGAVEASDPEGKE